MHKASPSAAPSAGAWFALPVSRIAKRFSTVVVAGVIAWRAVELGAAYALVALGVPVRILDEPLQLTGGLWVRLGQQPLVDFRSVYPPLNYYAAAAAFAIGGNSFVAYRLYQIAAYVVMVAFVTWQARRLGAGIVLTSVAFWSVTWMTGSTIETTTLPALTLAVIAVVTYARALDVTSARTRRLLFGAAGTAVFAAAAVRLNFGLYVGAAFAVDWGLWYVARRGRRGTPSWGDVAALLAGPTVGVLAFCIGWRGHLVEAVAQMILTPTRALSRYAVGSHLDPSTLDGLVRAMREGFFLPALPGLWMAARACQRPLGRRALPVALCLLSAVVATVLTFRLAPERPLKLPAVTAAIALPVILLYARYAIVERRELVSVLAQALTTHYFLSRADLPHLMGLLPTVALLVPYALPRRRKPVELLPALVLALLLGPFVRSRTATLTAESVGAGRKVWAEAGTFLRLGDAKVAETNASSLVHHLFDDADEIRAMAALRSHTTPSEPIFIGLASHKRTVINDVRAYWLAGRRTGVRDVLMMDGLTTSPVAERRIYRDLEDNHVRWIALWRGVPDSPGWGKLLHDGNGELDVVVRDSFAPRETFGAFELRERR